jgi:glc operon protein GlcG
MDNSPYSSIPRIVLLEGGLSIMTKDGQHIGLIGISGANPELDSIPAKAGIS